MDQSPTPAPAPAPSMSLVSRAKTAIHSAAAKAEKVITDIKADLTSDRESDGQSQKGSKRSAEQEILPVEETQLSKNDPAKEDSLDTCDKLTIPSTFIIKQLAMAIESTKDYTSVRDLLTPAGDSLLKEKSGLSFSAVKSLVLRDKDDKSSSLFCDHEVESLLHALFNTEDSAAERKTMASFATFPMVHLSKDICGAPPNSLLVRLSVLIGGLKTLQKMASCWCHFVKELRRLWSEQQPIPHITLDEKPDLKTCLLHQQLQVINCCIARKHRRALAIKSLDLALEQGHLGDNPENTEGKCLSEDKLYVRTTTGEYVLRLGADHPSEGLTMLETCEPIYSPVTQEGPVLTEDLIKETEEFVLRTGSVGAGCSQLLSDMQAFKAANPGCILEDFIRWHSPPDWTEIESDERPNDSSIGEDSSSRRGRLSRRMQKEGNLWRELWETAKPLPAVRQTPLFDEDLVVDGILNTLEDISPTQLFEQLFSSMLSSSFVIAEAAIPKDSSLSKLFFECKDYASAAYQASTLNDYILDICKVYETVENILLHPEEVVIISEKEEELTPEEPKRRFKKLSINFRNKDKQQLQKGLPKLQKKSSVKHAHALSNLFDKKTYLFSKKHSKSKDDKESDGGSTSAVEAYLDEQDWTIVQKDDHK